jgi:hypothetical protein
MIIIKVELHSAVTGEVTQIAEGKIWNAGDVLSGPDHICAYDAEFTTNPWPNRAKVTASNIKHSRADHVWHLVACALSRCFP